jgi:hypothetical protein
VLLTVWRPPDETIVINKNLMRLRIHRNGIVHHTRVEAEADSEHFDGKTTE